MASWLGVFTLVCAGALVSGGPTATVLNGTYEGVSVDSFHQEQFLGMPFAQPPLPPDLRLRPPQPLNTSWTETRSATQYSPICYGYATTGACDDRAYEESEDCLTLNVIRPEGITEGSTVPVMLWIFGGGFSQGGTADDCYNGSWIVQRSMEMGQPIIFASMNYRLNAFGFMFSQEVAAEGGGNYGLLDQRLAIEWVHENIFAFGGDPSKVTIMGESAGGTSVALQLLAYDETSTDLYRAAILESGTSTTWNYASASDYQPQYNAAVNASGCGGTSDTLTCLRAVSVETYINATNVTLAFQYGPVVDGTFLTEGVTARMESGRYVKVPLLLGGNLDEGTSFGPRGVDNDTALGAALISKYPYITEPVIDTLLELYPDEPSIGCPYGTGDVLLSTGAQDKRARSMFGDIVIHAGRRQLAQGVATVADVFSYHFAQPPDNATIDTGVQHFQEIPYVFNNQLPTSTPLSTRPGDLELATLMTSYWISFVHNLDPNHSGVIDAPYWPNYSYQPINIVFKRQGSYVELDNWRVQALDYINSLTSDLQH